MLDTRIEYDTLSKVYDFYTSGDDYDAWFTIVTDIARKHGVTEGRVWDVGTGTGKIASRFATAGWKVFATDLSEGMLEVARKRTAGLDVQFSLQDARTQSMLCNANLATAIDGVFNHMLTAADAAAAATNIAAGLCDGGLLIFDVNTEKSYRGFFSSTSVVKSNTFFCVTEPVGEQSFQPGGTSELEITIFETASDQVIRRTTRQIQRHHTLAEVLDFLGKSGLQFQEVYGLRIDGTLDLGYDENLHGKAIYVACKMVNQSTEGR